LKDFISSSHAYVVVGWEEGVKLEMTWIWPWASSMVHPVYVRSLVGCDSSFTTTLVERETCRLFFGSVVLHVALYFWNLLGLFSFTNVQSTATTT
jgi:hypothetical protein